MGINGNTIYLDNTGNVDISDNNNIQVSYIVLTPTAANGRIVLSDAQSTPVVKLDLRGPTSGSSVIMDLTRMSMVFPNGIYVSTITNAVATLIWHRAGKGNS